MTTRLKFNLLGLGLAGALASATLPASAAEAAPSVQLIPAVDQGSGPVALERVQYFYGGRNYCWYGSGWHGPGWYWCGYGWRRGFGWGGGYGWRGWGGHGGWHGGGWRGGWHDHDGWRGDHRR